jgi:poly(hydroxyalkanoate) depolymerase family esterase
MNYFVPEGLPSQAPLVVAMHGCAGSASVFAKPSGWVQLASTYQFALVLPSATSLDKCLGVQDAANQKRGAGQPLSIIQMVDWMTAHYSIDAARIFVTGFSSGGEMTNVMLGTYPDVFAAGGAMSGMPYMCATDEISFGTCTALGGRVFTAQEWAQRARDANPGNWTYPRMAIWHGTEDFIVASVNLQEEMKQWTELNGVDQIPDAEDEVNGFPHKVYADSNGVARVETFAMTDHGHLLPVAPGEGPEECGTVSLFTFSIDVGVCGAYHIVKWFGIAP